MRLDQESLRDLADGGSIDGNCPGCSRNLTIRAGAEGPLVSMASFYIGAAAATELAGLPGVETDNDFDAFFTDWLKDVMSLDAGSLNPEARKVFGRIYADHCSCAGETCGRGTVQAANAALDISDNDDREAFGEWLRDIMGLEPELLSIEAFKLFRKIYEENADRGRLHYRHVEDGVEEERAAIIGTR
jgi:hypothetical protein